MEDRGSAKKLTIIALSIAIICVATMAIQIPIPLGYMHLGNCFILLVSVFIDPITGAIAAGVGSAMADLLTSYIPWVIPTLIIKGLMGYIIGRISRDGQGRRSKILSIRILIAALAGIGVMVVGYTFAGMILYGGIAAGLAQTPGLIIEGVIAIVLFYIIAIALEKGKMIRF